MLAGTTGSHVPTFPVASPSVPPTERLVAERFDRPVGALLAGVAVTGQIEGDHLALVAEAFDLLGPVAAVAGPAMD